MSDVIDQFVKDLWWSGLAGWWDRSGCWDWEIREVEKYFNIKLPTVYRSFLKRMGYKAGRLGVGTDMFFKHLQYNRRAMEEVLELDGHPFELTPTEFVFSSHQGYYFHYFETSPLVDDPPVYAYMEDGTESGLVYSSFSAFLYGLLEHEK
jgi:hypothetical protein